MTSSVKYIYYVLTVVLIGSSFSLFAQESLDDSIILSAMRDELNRNMDSISYDGYENPFFIGYSFFNGESVNVKAVSGSVVTSITYPISDSRTRVMVGDYQLNDENYDDKARRKRHYDGSMPLPLGGEYTAIRRAFWLSTNNVYKNATESYKSKLAAMALKGINKDSLETADFSIAPKVVYRNFRHFDPIRTKEYETLAEEVSLAFRNTSSIYSNNVELFETRFNCFVVNSEGTEVVQPVSAFGLMIKAFAYTNDYKSVGSYINYVGESISDIPETEQIKSDVEAMIKHIEKKRLLPVYEDSYIGPILFMGQAVPRYLINKLINAGEGLIAKRNYLVNSASGGLNSTNYRTWENRLFKRVVDRSISVYSVTSAETYNGVKLLGAYDVDAEGVEPKDTLMLIEGGELKNQFISRTPIEKLTKSTGSKRYGFDQRGIKTNITPGNLFFESTKTFKTEELKKKLIDIAIDNGLDYAIIVKSIKTGDVNGAIEVYKVRSPDGEEELLRSVSLSKIDRESLWEIEGVSDANEVYNVLLSSGVRKTSSRTEDVLSGVPTSFIYPEAILIERGSIEGRKKPMKGIEPLVPSPL